MLYKGITSALLLPSGTTARFDVKRGIRQGDPVSPLLFIIATEILAIYIQNNDTIKPLHFADKSLKITQLADDTVLLLKNSDEIPNALKAVSSFSCFRAIFKPK